MTRTTTREDARASDGDDANGYRRPPDALTCKIAYGDDVVRMTLTGDMSLGHVVDRLVSSVDADPSALRLRYQDEEGEWCALNSDADLQECRVATRTLGGSMRIQASSTK